MRLRGSGPWRPASSLFGLLTLLGIRGALAAPPPYVVDVWQVEDGLPINGAFAVAQGRDGYLWVATQEGLARFDGVRFKVFDKGNTPAITHNDMRTLLAARDGSLWIGSDGGGLLRLKDGRLKSYSARDGLGHDSVSSLYEDERGVLWIGTNGGGLARLENGRFTRHTARDGLASDAVRALCRDGRGGLWIGMRGGLTRFAQGRFTSYTTRDGLPHDFVRALSLDRQGTLWVGTNGGGLARFRDGRFTTFTSREGLPNDSVLAIREDRAGALWVGTNGGGLGRLQDGVWTTFTTRDGLASDLIWSIEEDREGSLWLGLSGGGLTRLKAASFLTYGTREGLSDETALPVFQDRLGRLWVGTVGGGLNRLEAGRFVPQPTPPSVAGRPLLALADDRADGLWVGGAGSGLHRLRNGVWASFTTKDGLSSNLVSAIREDRRGVLWVGTAGAGLNRMSGGRFTTLTAKDGLANDVVWFIEEDRAGGLWIGTEGGLSHLVDRAFTNYTKRDGLGSDRISAFYEDEAGAVWVGTTGDGLRRLKDGKWAAITTRQGLFDDVVLRILPDAQGGLWMSCNKGIFRAAKRDLDDVADGRLGSLACVAYGRADGMRDRECNGGIHPAGWRSSDGRLWFPTMKGVVVTDPATLPPNTPPPPVVLEEILADGRPLAPGPGLRLPAGTERVELQYTGLSFLAPAEVRFRYRLEGFDRQWVEAGPRRTAFYTNLAPGRYRFRVTAANNDGVWNSEGTSLELALDPRFHQTAWFYGLCALALAGAGLGAHRLRLRWVRERELARLVDERTRDLLAEKQRAEATRDELARSEAKFRSLTQNSSDIIVVVDGEWAIRYASLSVEKLLGHSPAALEGRRLHELVHPDDAEAVGAILERCAGAAVPPAGRVRVRDGGGAWRTMECVASDLSAEPAVAGIVLNARDVSDRTELEEQLRQSQKMEAVGTLAGGVAHDFNNLLTVITGHSALLLRRSGLGEAAARDVEMIRASAERAASLTRQLLAFSRRQVLQPRVLDLNAVVADMDKMLRRLIGEDVELVTLLAPDLRWVKTDPAQVEQILMNLVVNARDAMPQGGKLVIETANADLTHDQPGRRLGVGPGRYALLAVSDSGHGIDRETLPRIFEPFFTTKEAGRGTGLGLSTVYGIVKQSGGDIWVYSEPGRGTTFKIYLPETLEAPEEAEEAPTPSAESREGATILLVEDDEQVRELSSEILREAGYTVLEAARAEKALEVCASHSGAIDLVITDVVMPGMSGPALVRSLAAAWPATRALFVSGYTEGAIARHGVLEPGTAFLEKPFTPDRLLAKVRELLA